MRVITKSSLKTPSKCIVGKGSQKGRGDKVSSNIQSTKTVDNANRRREDSGAVPSTFKGLETNKEIEKKKPIIENVINKLNKANNNIKRKNIKFSCD